MSVQHPWKMFRKIYVLHHNPCLCPFIYLVCHQTMVQYFVIVASALSLWLVYTNVYTSHKYYSRLSTLKGWFRSAELKPRWWVWSTVIRAKFLYVCLYAGVYVRLCWWACLCSRWVRWGVLLPHPTAAVSMNTEEQRSKSYLDQVRQLRGQKVFEFVGFQCWTIVGWSRVELGDQCVDGLLKIWILREKKRNGHSKI